MVKPVDEGSSLGVKICNNLNRLVKVSKKLLKKYPELIFEKYIGGQEVQVAVINNKPLGAIELIPKKDLFMITKLNTKAAKTQHVMPARISKNNYKQVLGIAKKLIKLWGVGELQELILNFLTINFIF